MVTVLGAFQVSLCGAFLTAAVATLPVEYLIYRHMRRHHREAFDKLGIRGPAFLWREDRNSEDTGFEDFVSSRKHAAPDDSRLKSMLRLKSLIWRLCGVSFGLLLLTFVVFRADSARVWDFLVDLSRY